MSKEAHVSAATYHEAAAKSHRAAAEHYEAGNQTAANKQNEEAVILAEKAYAATKHASEKSSHHKTHA